MCMIVLVFFNLACAGHGRRVRTEREGSEGNVFEDDVASHRMFGTRTISAHALPEWRQPHSNNQLRELKELKAFAALALAVNDSAAWAHSNSVGLRSKADIALPRDAWARTSRVARPNMHPAIPKSINPEALSALTVAPEDADMPAASQGPFGKGGALEWVANIADVVSDVTLAGLHAFDDKAVKDSSKNLQVLWSRAVLAKKGELKDDVAFDLLPRSTRDVVKAGAFDGISSFLEWIEARTVFLNEGCDAFLSSPSCADGKDCQIVIFGAGFDTRSIRYQRKGLRFFEIDLPDTIEAKRVVQERYRDDVNPEVRLPSRVGFDLNDCANTSLLELLQREHGFRRDLPTMFISEAVMFYVTPKAIANLYAEIFAFGQETEAMYCFTDSMRPFVQGPFSDEISTFMDKSGISVLSHKSRWAGAVQFMHAVARTPTTDGSPTSLLNHVTPLVEPPMTSYAPERCTRSPKTTPSFNNAWYAIAYASELRTNTPYSTRLFGEPLTLLKIGEKKVRCTSDMDRLEYVAADHDGLVWLWRGDPSKVDHSMLPTHPTPEQTYAVETILDYGVDWKYIVENNLDTPHLYWLHDGSIPPLDSLGCNRENIAKIGLRFFTDDVGVGHIGKTSTKVTKVVRLDAPNIVRHGGVSGFSEEFNIIPIGPHRTRVLLRQRFPKGPILSSMLNMPGVEPLLQYLVRQWNYQIGLEDYSVMQGQAHNIDDFGAKNWDSTSTGDDLIVKFWKTTRNALKNDGIESEYFTRWDGSKIDAKAAAAVTPVRIKEPSHASSKYVAVEGKLRSHYLQSAPVADYPPVNHMDFNTLESFVESVPERARIVLQKVMPWLVGGCTSLVAGACLNPTEMARASTEPLNELLSQIRH